MIVRREFAVAGAAAVGRGTSWASGSAIAPGSVVHASHAVGSFGLVRHDPSTLAASGSTSLVSKQELVSRRSGAEPAQIRRGQTPLDALVTLPPEANGNPEGWCRRRRLFVQGRQPHWQDAAGWMVSMQIRQLESTGEPRERLAGHRGARVDHPAGGARRPDRPGARSPRVLLNRIDDGHAAPCIIEFGNRHLLGARAMPPGHPSAIGALHHREALDARRAAAADRRRLALLPSQRRRQGADVHHV